MKQCSSCGRIKPAADFHRAERRRDGLQAKCKHCNYLTVAAWRKQHPDRYQFHTARWSETRRQRRTMRAAQQREAAA